MKIKGLILILFLFFISSFSLVRVNAENNSGYIITSNSFIDEDLNYLGLEIDYTEKFTEILTFVIGKDLKGSLTLYLYLKSPEEFSQIELIGATIEEGYSDFSDVFNVVSKLKDNESGNIIYKCIFDSSNKRYSLLTMVKLLQDYEFNVSEIRLDNVPFNIEIGNFFNQRFKFMRVENSPGVWNYYVHSINDRYVKVNADLAKLRFVDNSNSFLSFIPEWLLAGKSSDFTDLFYVLFDVNINNQKVIYDIYQIDLKYTLKTYDANYCKNPAPLIGTYNYITLTHPVEFEETITSKDFNLVYSTYTDFWGNKTNSGFACNSLFRISKDLLKSSLNKIISISSSQGIKPSCLTVPKREPPYI